mgnify:CR=1 FL=1
MTASMMAVLLAGCGSGTETNAAAEASSFAVIDEPIPEQTTQASAEEGIPVTTEEPTGSKELPAGTYRSELTGEAISTALRNQKPIAVMVDNEKLALPHYGTAEADIVYELMNSTANDRITRLMCLYKDYENIEQIGSIRSTRPTNILLAAEYNAMLCHDGGPFYIDAYLANDYAQHFSGTFSRVKNGKSMEFTEYILKGDVDDNFSNSRYSKEYDSFKPSQDTHFQFVDYGTEMKLSDVYGSALRVRTIELPFKHTSSRLVYNESTQTYDFYDYGSIHKDAEDGQVMSFKNVILQECPFSQYDSNGYLIYNCINVGYRGYYITNGEAKDITWTKTSDTDITRFYDSDGKEIQVNQGKTYISLVPDDSWDKLVLAE